MIGIISYLPANEELRTIRLGCLMQVVEFWSRIIPGEDIHIMAQCFTESDRNLINGNVIWHLSDIGLGPAKARNILLHEFYDSDDKWLILTDDDVILYDYYEPEDIIKDIYEGKHDDYPMDIILAVSPQLRPFKDRLLKSDVEHYHIFNPSTLSDIPNFMLLRRTNFELYYDEQMLENNIPEDATFIIQAIVQYKMKVLICLNFIKKNLALYDSTLCEEETAQDTRWHRELTLNLKNYIYEKYNIEMSRFSRLYNKAVPFTIARKTPYILPERLATVVTRHKKPKTNSLRKLF